MVGHHMSKMHMVISTDHKNASIKSLNLFLDEEKGYSVRDLMISKPCRAEHYLSNDIKYVRIGQILTKLQTSEHTTVRTHRNREMANCLLFIDIRKN